MLEETGADVGIPINRTTLSLSYTRGNAMNEIISL